MASGLVIRLVVFALIAAAIAGGVGWLHHDGVLSERRKWQELDRQERAARAVEIAGLGQDLSDATKEREEQRAIAARNRAQLTAERKERLNEFVPKTADSGTCLRVGFVRFTDAAAAGVPLGPRLGPGIAEAPAGVETDAAAGLIAENYGYYHECKKRVGDILTNFDEIRGKTNSVVDRINQRVKRAEGRVQ